MFGWTAEEVVGEPATLLGLAETDGAGMDRRRHLAEYGRWRGEMTVERKDGTGARTRFRSRSATRSSLSITSGATRTSTAGLSLRSTGALDNNHPRATLADRDLKPVVVRIEVQQLDDEILRPAWHGITSRGKSDGVVRGLFRPG